MFDAFTDALNTKTHVFDRVSGVSVSDTKETNDRRADSIASNLLTRLPVKDKTSIGHFTVAATPPPPLYLYL